MSSLADEIQRLTTTTEDLVRVQRDLLQASQRAPGGSGPVTPGGGAATPAVAGAAAGPGIPQIPFWQQGARSEGAAGMTLSATRNLLSAAGAPGAASLVGGFASGGVFGALVAGAGVGLQEVARERERGLSIRQVGYDAAGSAPVSDTDNMAMVRARTARALRQVDVEEERENSVLNPEFKDPAQEESRAFERADRRRRIRAREGDELGPQERALGQTRDRMANFARAGGMSLGPEGDRGRQIAEQIYQIYLRREQGLEDFEKWARVRDRRMQSDSPGSHSTRQVR